MKPLTNQPGAGPDAGPDIRLRTMRILWVVFLITIGLFILVAGVSRPEGGPEGEGVPPLLYALGALALSSVAASFVLKSSLYKRAAERQEPAQLQTGFIIALVLCESAVLFGLVGLFITRCDYAYALFALGALGEALHFPRRAEVLSAYYKAAG
jgi:F0F1-type ATP synthase membrane subunit c/vacuolar-type H+-ATPase subunit K